MFRQDRLRRNNCHRSRTAIGHYEAPEGRAEADWRREPMMEHGQRLRSEAHSRRDR
jgi:hypothetical protein